MKVHVHKEPFPHLIIEDFYSNEELIDIHQEINFLEPKLGNDTRPATDVRGAPLKRGTGVFVDDIYADRSYSNLLTLGTKLFHEPTVIEGCSYLGLYFKLWEKVDWHSTLFQAYKHGDFYKGHTDESIFTFIYMLSNSINFTGGDIWFEEYERTVPFEYNTGVLFPSILKHEITEVKGYGTRYSISNFICKKNYV